MVSASRRAKTSKVKPEVSSVNVKPPEVKNEDRELRKGRLVIPQIRREDLTSQQNEDLIGRGSYGKCFKSTYRGNLLVVVKQLRSSVDHAQAMNEAQAIMELQSIEHHPSLPLLIGVSFRIRPYLIVTQFHGDKDNAYTLGAAVKDGNILTSCNQWLDILVRLAKALGFIHNQGWIHNDLKQNNVVLHLMGNNEWKPVIIDFGKSVKRKLAMCPSKKRSQTIFYWIAPEVSSCASPPSPSSDIFALGHIIKIVAKDALKTPSDELYAGCLATDPNARPSSAQAVAAMLSDFKKRL